MIREEFKLNFKVYVYHFKDVYNLLKAYSLESLVFTNIDKYKFQNDSVIPLFSTLFSIQSQVEISQDSKIIKLKDNIDNPVKNYYSLLSSYIEENYKSFPWLLSVLDKSAEKKEYIKKFLNTLKDNLIEDFTKNIDNISNGKITIEKKDITKFVLSINHSNSVEQPSNKATININIDRRSSIYEQIKNELYDKDTNELLISENDIVEIRVKYPKIYDPFPGEYYDDDGYYRMFIGFISELKISKSALEYMSLSLQCEGIYKILELQKAIYTTALGQSQLFEKNTELQDVNVNIFQNKFTRMSAKAIFEDILSSIFLNGSNENINELLEKESTLKIKIPTASNAFSYDIPLKQDIDKVNFQFITYIPLLYILVKFIETRDTTSKLDLSFISAYHDGIDIPPYELAIQEAFRLFYPVLKTPLDILREVVINTFCEFFENDQGVLILRTPKYNQIDLFYDFLEKNNSEIKTDNRITLDKDITDVNSDYIIIPENIISYSYDQKDPSIVTRSDMQFYFPLNGQPLPTYTGHYTDPYLLAKYGMRPVEPMNNPLSINPAIAEVLSPLVLANKNKNARIIQIEVINNKPYKLGYLYFIPTDSSYKEPLINSEINTTLEGVEKRIYGYVGYLEQKQSSYAPFKGFTTTLTFTYVRKANIIAKQVKGENFVTKPTYQKYIEFKKLPDTETILNLAFKFNVDKAQGMVEKQTPAEKEKASSITTSEISENGFYIIPNGELSYKYNYKREVLENSSVSSENIEDFLYPFAVRGKFESTVEAFDNTPKNKYFLSYLTILDKLTLETSYEIAFEKYNKFFKPSIENFVKAVIRDYIDANKLKIAEVEKRLKEVTIDFSTIEVNITKLTNIKLKPATVLTNKVFWITVKSNTGDSNFDRIARSFGFIACYPLNKLPKPSYYAIWKEGNSKEEGYILKGFDFQKSIEITNDDFLYNIFIFRTTSSDKVKGYDIQDMLTRRVLYTNKNAIHANYNFANYYKDYSIYSVIKPMDTEFEFYKVIFVIPSEIQFRGTTAEGIQMEESQIEVSKLNIDIPYSGRWFLYEKAPNEIKFTNIERFIEYEDSKYGDTLKEFEENMQNFYSLRRFNSIDNDNSLLLVWNFVYLDKEFEIFKKEVKNLYAFNYATWETGTGKNTDFADVYSGKVLNLNEVRTNEFSL